MIYLETILEIDRYNLEAFLMLIRIYLRMENYELAMEYCEEAYEKFDKKSRRYIFYGSFVSNQLEKIKKQVFYYKEFLEIEKKLSCFVKIWEFVILN